MREILQGNQKTISEELRLSFAEQLLAQAQVLVEQDQRLTDLENELVELKNRVVKPENDVEKPLEDYLTFDSYVRLRDIPIRRSAVDHLTSEAKRLTEVRGAERGVTESGHITYRIDILDEVFAAYETNAAFFML